MTKWLPFALAALLFMSWQCTPAARKVERKAGPDDNPSGQTQVVPDMVTAEEKTGADAQNLDWEGTDQAQKEVFRDIHFEYERYTLQKEGQDILAGIAKAMNTRKDINVTIEGHCDERGSDEYNLALGEKRAEGVRNYLAKSGIGEARMNLISFGEERPFVPGHTEEAYVQNRRVHFEVHK